MKLTYKQQLEELLKNNPVIDKKLQKKINFLKSKINRYARKTIEEYRQELERLLEKQRADPNKGRGYRVAFIADKLGVKVPPQFRSEKRDRTTKKTKPKSTDSYWHRLILSSSNKKETYYQYLKSPEWLVVRDRIFKKKGKICSACKCKEELVIHHLTYKNVGQEKDHELVVLCNTCHRLEHGL